MGLKINNIIVLENKEEFLILNGLMHNGKKYFLTMGLDESRKVDAKNVVILEEYVSGFETYVTKVVDVELLGSLTKLFKDQLKTA